MTRCSRMKMLALILLPALASCGMASAGESPRTERAQTRLTRALEGRTAGAPQACLPRFGRSQQRIIDSGTILYGEGGTLYRNDPPGGCNGMTQGRTLVITSIQGQLCRGDIVQVVEQTSGAQLGSCALGDFIPYTRARAAAPEGS